MIMFPLLIRVYDFNTKYTTVKPCKLLLLLRPTGRRQPVHRSMKANKVARPNFTTRPGSFKGRKYSTPGAYQPSKATSRSLLRSDISKDKGQRCRTNPGNPARWPQAGLKVYISPSSGQKAQLLYSTRTAHKLPFKGSYCPANKEVL